MCVIAAPLEAADRSAVCLFDQLYQWLTVMPVFGFVQTGNKNYFCLCQEREKKNH